MISYLKNRVSSLIFENDDDDGDILSVIQKEKDDIVQKQVINESIGSITQVKHDFGVIDDKYSFLSILSTDEFEVGDQVWYKLCQTVGGGGRVVSIGLLSKKKDDETFDDALDENEEVVNVVERKGRELFLSNNAKCHLDNVDFDGNFTPVVGDVLKLGEKGDNMKLGVVSYHKFEGAVVEYSDGYGLIKNETLWFNAEALESGYEPIVGDFVKCIAVENVKNGRDKWRAITISYVRHIQDFEDIYNEQLNFNQVVKIEGESDFGEIFLNSSAKLKLKIRSDDCEAQKLLKCGFRRRDSIISLVGCKTPMTIEPFSYVDIILACHPKHVGYTVEVLDLQFQDFVVSRRCTVLVTCTSLMNFERISIPVKRQKDLYLDDPEERRRRTYGERITPASHFKKMNRFCLPAKLKNIFKETSEDILASLLENYPVLNEALGFSNYALRWHTLLYLEELNMMIKIKSLARSHVFFKKRGEYLVLEIENLAEQRPSLIVSDKVIVRQPWNTVDKADHVGFIHHISKDSISCVFNETFHNSYDETDCDVSFELNTSMYSMYHNAVDRAVEILRQPFLFPTFLTVKRPLLNFKDSDIVWYNKALNIGQRSAIVNVLHATCRPLPYVIFGPPGTGKTQTVVELVLQLIRLSGKSRVLIAAPSNSAADLLVERLVVAGRLVPGQIVRLMAYSRPEEDIPENVKPYVVYDDNFQRTRREGNLTGWHAITVGTCCSAGFLHSYTLPKGHFTHVVVDEAGFATEPENLLPLTLVDFEESVVVLAGDPKQLGPLVSSDIATKYGLTESFLSRILSRFPYARDILSYPDTQGFDPRLVTRFTINYRSVPEILKLPSAMFYHSDLKSTVTGLTGREAEIIAAFNKEKMIRDSPVTILFHGIRGQNIQEADSPSWLNPHELFEAVQYVRLLHSFGVDSSEIGVITPYKKQATKVRTMLTEFGEDIPKVGCVENFQGQERQVIILSCVRSEFSEIDRRYNLGFLSNPRRLNVAITRARCLLIILGNPHVLSLDPYWRSVLKYCIERRAYIGCDVPDGLNSVTKST